MSKLGYNKLNMLNSRVVLSGALVGLALMASAGSAQAQDAPPPTLEAVPAVVPPPPEAAVTGVVPPTMVPPSNQQVQAAPDAAPPGTVLPPAMPTAAPPAVGAEVSAEVGGAASVPSLSDVLGSQNGQVEQPANLPPGFDLPMDQSLPEIEKTKEEKALELRQKAFDSAVNGLFPLKPDEIRKMMEIQDETKQAIEVPIYPSPKPESAFTSISLDPGAAPLVVKTAMGNVTTLSMVDATGQPWPILDISWAGNFEVLQPENGSNMLRITPLSEFATGNVSMRMVGLNVPIILAFKADRESVHVRLDVQIPEVGPNGVAPLINASLTNAAAGDARLSSVLEGVAPARAKKLTVSGVDGRTSAYDLAGTMYVRTPYTLLSPAWTSSVRSADGTNVYSLGATPVLLLSDKGKMVRAYLSGEEKADGQ